MIRTDIDHRGSRSAIAEAGGGSSGEADPGPRFAPLYRQIHDLLARALQAGEWSPGAMIPTEQALARRYQVSPGTVRKAIDQLVAGHMLVRRQGRGTFVATHHEHRAQFRFLRLRDPDDGVPRFNSRVLSCRRARAGQEVARALGLRVGESTVQIRRVLDFEGEPTVLDDIWLPGDRFRGLTAERLAAHHGPLYTLFESEFGTRMLQATERLRAASVDADIAILLQLPVGAPVLIVERISETYASRPVEFRRGVYRTEHYHYLNELR